MGMNGVALEDVKVISGEAPIETDRQSGKTSGDVKAELANEAEQFMAHLRGASNLKERVENGTAVMSQRRASQKMLDSMKDLSTGHSTSRSSRVIRVELAWRDLEYQVAVGHWRKRTLKSVLQSSSAAMPPGRLLAVMGPTGCGKTSLVNALAGRLPRGGLLEGEITVNGIPRGKGFRTITAYVMQDDILFHNLTVRETFEFAAKMRLPASVPASAKSELVTEIITELGLAKAQSSYIGNAFVRGISGGERKRVNIGIELLSNPSLIFLDEPTSGLDAFQAQNVMELLWSLSNRGRSVVSTIHQPRSSIYKMFDLLLLLSEGHVLYYGPAAQAVAWFAACGFPCPAHYNPADFFLDVVSLDSRAPDVEQASRRRIALLAEQYKEAGTGKIKAAPVDSEDVRAMQEVNDSPGFPNSLPVEFGLLLQRAWKQQGRDRMPQIITIMQTLVIGFVLAALYSQMQMNQVGINDELGILFFISIFVSMGALFSSIATFPVDAGVVNRERAGKAYHVLPYYLARFICDMPLRVGQGMLFGTIIYWIVGLNPSAEAFFIFVALIILEGLASQGLGTAISAATRNEKVAMAFAPAITTVLMLFGGFYVNKETIPAALRWLSYLSHLYWGFMGLAINNFQLGFENNHLWEPFLGMSLLILGYNILGYLLLRFKKPKFLPLTPTPKKA